MMPAITSRALTTMPFALQVQESKVSRKERSMGERKEIVKQQNDRGWGALSTVQPGFPRKTVVAPMPQVGLHRERRDGQVAPDASAELRHFVVRLLRPKPHVHLQRIVVGTSPVRTKRRNTSQNSPVAVKIGRWPRPSKG